MAHIPSFTGILSANGAHDALSARLTTTRNQFYICLFLPSYCCFIILKMCLRRQNERWRRLCGADGEPHDHPELEDISFVKFYGYKENMLIFLLYCEPMPRMAAKFSSVIAGGPKGTTKASRSPPKALDIRSILVS